MSKLMQQDITGRVRDNVFYDTFKEVVELYKDENLEVWEEAATIVIPNAGADTGLFPLSDIIVVYEKDTGKPSIVTERLYKSNYSPREWRKMRKYLKLKGSVMKQELGFNIRISFAREYIDYVHYREEWWQWALKNSKSKQSLY